MKFLIAIVLYRVERKLTPLLKTNLSVFVLPVFPSFPVLDSAARDSALVLPRCLCRSRLLESVSKTHLPSKGRTCSLQIQAAVASPGAAHGAGASRAFAVWVTGCSPWLGLPYLGHRWTNLCCVDAGASVRADELGHRRERPGKALGWTLRGPHTPVPREPGWGLDRLALMWTHDEGERWGLQEAHTFPVCECSGWPGWTAAPEGPHSGSAPEIHSRSFSSAIDSPLLV